ncbi:MAG: dihydroneopterin aldolase [Candidatus Omnitrophica bacterium]|nr:dihydroneopterin aldolase [Candidatus Omnitrophota bacterium]
MNDKIFIEQLEASCLIGIYDWERKIKQKITIDLEFPTNVRKAARTDKIKDALNYKNIAKHTLEFISHSRFFLIETLAEKLAASILKKFKVSWIRLRLSKPGALRHCKNVGLEILRKR